MLVFGGVGSLCAYSQISSYSFLELVQLSGTEVATDIEITFQGDLPIGRGELLF